MKRHPTPSALNKSQQMSFAGAAAGYASFLPKYTQVKADPGLNGTLLGTKEGKNLPKLFDTTGVEYLYIVMHINASCPSSRGNS